MMKYFFVIRYSFMDWMFKHRLLRYTFNMTDDLYPGYEFKIVVERSKINYDNNK